MRERQRRVHNVEKSKENGHNESNAAGRQALIQAGRRRVTMHAKRNPACRECSLQVRK